MLLPIYIGVPPSAVEASHDPTLRCFARDEIIIPAKTDVRIDLHRSKPETKISFYTNEGAEWELLSETSMVHFEGKSKPDPLNDTWFGLDKAKPFCLRVDIADPESAAGLRSRVSYSYFGAEIVYYGGKKNLIARAKLTFHSR
jgi:hypothetical protein